MPSYGAPALAGHRLAGKEHYSYGNPHKLLMDPYAKALSGHMRWDDALFGYTISHPDEDLSFDERDSAPFMPKAIVIDPAFSWGGDTPPATPWHRTIIYELHVKGFTARHPDVPEHLRGTYAGLTQPAIIDYLLKLGIITAVELMPVHQFVIDKYLLDKGLTNYWGYNSCGFFSPEVGYSSSGNLGQQVNEFKTLVKTLHREGTAITTPTARTSTGAARTLSFR